MSTSSLLAKNIMNTAASALNDTERSVYTYDAQMPYLNMALQELKELFQLNSVPVTEKRSAIIELEAGDTEIKFNNGTKSLPSDLVEPIQLWESTNGTNSWIPLTHRDFLPPYMDSIQTSSYIYYSWRGNKIELPLTNGNNDIKMDYVADLFYNVINESSPINIINGKGYLGYKTAALCARFIGANPSRANELDVLAIQAMDRSLGISSKGKQNIVTRRRPFRSGYKARGY
jgi:hypothetical protein